MKKNKAAAEIWFRKEKDHLAFAIEVAEKILIFVAAIISKV